MFYLPPSSTLVRTLHLSNSKQKEISKSCQERKALDKNSQGAHSFKQELMGHVRPFACMHIANILVPCWRPMFPAAHSQESGAAVQNQKSQHLQPQSQERRKHVPWNCSQRHRPHVIEPKTGTSTAASLMRDVLGSLEYWLGSLNGCVHKSGAQYRPQYIQ